MNQVNSTGTATDSVVKAVSGVPEVAQLLTVLKIIPL
jgi:hypothetical protein